MIYLCHLVPVAQVVYNNEFRYQQWQLNNPLFQSMVLIICYFKQANEESVALVTIELTFSMDWRK